MRRVIDRKQTVGLDRGIALRRRQTGVAEQLLDRAQVAAAAQEMSRKTVPQRVRRRTFGEAEQAAQRLHLPLHLARAESIAAGADEERAVAGKRIRTDRDIFGDRLAYRGESPGEKDRCRYFCARVTAT